jgi:uncharacterized protein
MAAVLKTPANVTNPPRNIEFVRQPHGAQHWHLGGEDATDVYDALSMLFPDGERFFIESVKLFRDKADGKLADDIRDFIAQESLHTREHVAFNNLCDAPAELKARADEIIRAQIDESRRQGPIAMLCATVALEHLTAVFADIVLRDPSVMDCRREDVQRLWVWHAMEEAEHKGVTFDLFLKVSEKWTRWQRYRARVISMVLATHMFLWNWSTISLWLMEQRGVTGLSARWRLLKVWFGRKGLFRRSAGGFLSWFFPEFHPWDHDNRALIAQWRGAFPAAAPHQPASSAEAA